MSFSRRGLGVVRCIRGLGVMVVLVVWVMWWWRCLDCSGGGLDVVEVDVVWM